MRCTDDSSEGQKTTNEKVKKPDVASFELLNIDPVRNPELISDMFWEAKKQVELGRKGERMRGEQSIEQHHLNKMKASKQVMVPTPVHLLSRTERRRKRLKKRISLFLSTLFAPIVDWYSVLRDRKNESAPVEWGEPKPLPPCEDCHSFGFKPCDFCNMLGVRYTRTGRAKATCIHCRGFGWLTCPSCKGHQLEPWMYDIYL
eukprot:jgi/Galph1/4176/GphlegSOOS_G2817.1